jgi:Kef-type K+ transport system membrane component KefB
MAGVHTIFGAFLIGLAFPQQNPSTLRLAKTIEDFASIVFLPLYFAASGLRTQVGTWGWLVNLESVVS